MTDPVHASLVTIKNRRCAKSERRKDNQAPAEPVTDASDIVSEQSCIGSLLLDSSKWDDVHALVEMSDFFFDSHRRIYAAIQRLCEAGKHCDIVTVNAALEQSNEIELMGGLQYLGDIANNTPGASRAAHYACVVRERSIMRQLADAGRTITAIAENPSTTLLPNMLIEARELMSAVIAEYREYAAVKRSANATNT